MKNITAYVRPTTIAEAVQLMRQHPGRGKYIAGGTNIVVEKDPTLDYLVDLHHLGLEYITEDDDFIRIGACTTIEELYQSDLANTLASGVFAQVARWFGSTQIRNVATIGGNVADGLSAADTIPALLAMDALVVIVGETERTLPLTVFLRQEGGTILQHELIREFRIPKTFQRARGTFLKQCKTHEDISIVSVTTTVIVHETRCQCVRIALGAVAPIPVRIREAEALLEGQIPTTDLIHRAADVVVQHIHPVDNFRASAEFRTTISRVYTQRALKACVQAEE
ncbi:hypothetical protein GF339_22520 [candidate division KSB3 bacterium]|uniref:FAD-binding PCMH-type domain-containing protein n=1 Tax=candidate division KSB3 bacterium TaxID=2044937 RepID=A0A9D5K086_9BACT|nr:hypothetical protein [candidate division KSB3 bacterium]MBD3327378.1 hypothetical protein [candidate division KSB3 bacterium]